MTYNELLKQKEWWSKCNEILSRDHYTCKDCGCLGFHNGYSYAVIDDMDAIDNIFGSWKIDGKSISQFCANLTDYDLEHFDDVKLKKLEAIDETSSILHFRLYGKESKYFRGQPRGFSYGDFISDVTCDKISIDALHLYRVVKHDSLNFDGDWLYAFKFGKVLANKIYLLINYSYEQYIISVNYEDTLIVIALYSSKDNIFKGLNIHHTYYIEGKKPWEYEDEALETLCEDCHKKRHEKAPIPTYRGDMSILGLTSICPRCGGSGYLPQYSHVEHGICFKCGGEGVIIND